MEKDGQTDDFRQLLRLVDGTEGIKGFLDGMSALAATTMSRATGARIGCAVTLRRHKHSPTTAGSGDAAIFLDGIEQALGDGPGLAAVSRGAPVLLADAATDRRWAGYSRELAAAGYPAALGVPLQLRQDATAALTFYATAQGLFTGNVVAVAVDFADMSSQALRLSVRIAAADLLSDNLKAAMERRTAINMACGVIIAQSRCSQEEAFGILRQVSNSRNQKLHTIASEIVTRFSGPHGTATHFEG